MLLGLMPSFLTPSRLFFLSKDWLHNQDAFWSAQRNIYLNIFLHFIQMMSDSDEDFQPQITKVKLLFSPPVQIAHKYASLSVCPSGPLSISGLDQNSTKLKADWLHPWDFLNMHQSSTAICKHKVQFRSLS